MSRRNLEPIELDYGAANDQVNSFIEEQLAIDTARFDREAAIEQELTAPFLERAREVGLVPENPDFTMLKHHLEQDFQAKLEASNAESQELGILRQYMPAGPSPTVPQIPQQRKRKPYSSEGESSRTGANQSFADRVSGIMKVEAESHFSGTFDFSTASLAQRFRMRNDNYRISPTCTLKDRGLSAAAWGFFSNATVQLDLFIFTSLVTPGKQTNWVKRSTIYRHVNAWVGTVGHPFPPAFTTRSGYGQADAGDDIIVTATLIARAKAPTGFAKITSENELLSITIND